MSGPCGAFERPPTICVEPSSCVLQLMKKPKRPFGASTFSASSSVHAYAWFVNRLVASVSHVIAPETLRHFRIFIVYS